MQGFFVKIFTAIGAALLKDLAVSLIEWVKKSIDKLLRKKKQEEAAEKVKDAYKSGNPDEVSKKEEEWLKS